MICPLCGHEQEIARECSRCGVIFERMHTLGRPRPVVLTPPPIPDLKPLQRHQKILQYLHTFWLTRPPPTRHRQVFFVQLGRMLHSGVPMDEALGRIGDVVGHASMHRAVRAMAVDVTQGLSLSAAMERHPTIFDEVERAVVAALEHTGDLPRAASKLATRAEEARKRAGILRNAAAYPIFLVTVSILTEPLPTAVLSGMGAFLREILPPLTVWLLLLALAFLVLPSLLGRPQVRTAMLDALGRLPLGLLVNRRYALLFDVLAQTLEAGLPLPRSLELATRSTGEPALQQTGRIVALAVEKGATLAVACEGLPGLDSASRATIAAGERTGHLPETFAELAKERQEAWAAQLKLMTRILAGLATVCAMLYVGWSLIQQVQNGAGNPLKGLPESDMRELQKVMGTEFLK